MKFIFKLLLCMLAIAFADTFIHLRDWKFIVLMWVVLVIIIMSVYGMIRLMGEIGRAHV